MGKFVKGAYIEDHIITGESNIVESKIVYLTDEVEELRQRLNIVSETVMNIACDQKRIEVQNASYLDRIMKHFRS